jgi:uncharacterized protein (TIGR02265 family)
MAPRRVEDADFIEPSWADDVPLDRYLASCPESAETRGTFFQHVCDLIHAEIGAIPEETFRGLSQRRWLPFQSYPLREFMRLAYAGAKLVYPRLSQSDGLRRIGWRSYPSFADTMAGRVVLFALGDQLEDVVRACPKAYAIGLPGATVSTREIAPQHWHFELRDVHSFADSYHYGVLEGAVLAFKRVPDIRIRRLARLSDADFEVRWS